MASLRIRELRKAKGMTGEHLGDLVGVSKGYISELETGKKQPGPDLLQRLAAVLDVPIAGLFSDPEHGALTDEELRLLGWFRTVPEHERHLVKRLLQAAAEQPQDAPEASAAPPDEDRATPK